MAGRNLLSPRYLIHFCIISATVFTPTEQSSRQKRDSSGNQPTILTQNGHLIFQTSTNHNITFRSSSGGFVNIDGENLLHVAQQVRDNKEKITVLQNQPSTDSTVLSRLSAVEQRLDDLPSIAQTELQLAHLSTVVDSLTTRVATLEQAGSSTSGGATSSDIQSLQTRLTDLENTVRRLRRTLTNNECDSTPCQNGGTCVDLYDSFYCRCTQNFQGARCETDVNECATLAGTDLGCQNGASCINTHGSFRCQCTANWFGVRCTQSHDDCTGASNQDLCGHGTCINVQRTGTNMPKYDCVCDAGWTSDGTSPACVVDVDECSAPNPPCSASPAVQCINLPGSFACGACPPGYSGNGYVCVDIDECLVNNGGCSRAPHVECINNVGSRTCGSCPSGYRGDGVTCTYIGICNDNNGGCHSMALCRETQSILGRTCTCQSGYTGSGEGVTGCVQISAGGGGGGGGSSSGGGGGLGACLVNPCVNGRCTELPLPTGATYICTCDPGYEGTNCNRPQNACGTSPCQNGGTCTSVSGGGYQCQCTSSYTGFNCETAEQSCGGRLSGLSGTLNFPWNTGQSYTHNQNCAWVITTVPNKILSVSFSNFKLEVHAQCRFDFLQIHDGANAAAHSIGRYCGNQLPEGGHINTTHNQIYMWFHSDSSTSGDGFSLTWMSVDPACGGSLRGQDHGTIMSPGYPGVYPHGRDCTWNVYVSPGKKILFTFGHLALEHHENCSYDSLTVRDGFLNSDPILATHCSTVDPPPLMTTGPYAQITFHSDQSRNDNGFQISYAAQPVAPGCGGEYTTPTGILISPNYPNPYSHSVQCVWTISTPGDDPVTLTFTNFDLEDHRNCRYDYVELRDGEDETAPFVGRYCGNQLPNAVVSTGNSLWVKFRADSSNTRPGFRATWLVECGGTFTEPTGELTSPYFPNPYPSTRECIYLIEQPLGTAIILTFLTFDIEASSNNNCTYDYLEIRNGETEESPLAAKLCGTTLPAEIVSTSSTLRLKFRSDGSVQNHGFRLTYATEEVGSGVDPDETGGCGGVLTDPTGSFTSPRHPNYYPHGADCTWFITAAPGFLIRITFDSFDLEGGSCVYDSLSLYDHFNHSSRIGKFCGSVNPGVITSQTNTLMAVFRSDSSVTRQGFSANYVTLNASTVCGGTFRSVSGIITSPGYPGPYTADRECEYLLSVNTGRQVLINVTDFNIQADATNNCSHDYLEIRNGGYATSPLIGRYCGNTIDPIIRSYTHLMYLKFVSDSTVNGQGFSISYDGTSTGCGAELTDWTGIFVSPNYPEPFRSYSECVWTIRGFRGSEIIITFDDFDVLSSSSYCHNNRIEVWNGAVTTGELLQTLCSYSQSLSPPPVSVTSSLASVKFRSDYYHTSGRGFMISYVTSCNVRLTARSGVIESPSFPSSSPVSRDCSWVIETTVGSTVNAAFSHFEIQDNNNCQNSSIEIHDGEDAQAPLIGRFCGVYTLPPVVTTTSRFMFIHFVKLAETTGFFRLEYVVVGCGGNLAGPTGIISSPGYPQPYNNQTECVWRIETTTSTRIQLNITDLDLEPATDCQIHNLQVLGGDTLTSPELSNTCNTTGMSLVQTSTGNHMLVKFMTAGSTSHRGFQANYTEVVGGCGGIFTTTSGTVMSQNYPGNYPHNNYCIWSITVNSGGTVILVLEDFQLEGAGYYCRYDYLAVYDGPNVRSPRLLKRCGTISPNSTILHSTSNQMTLLMRTDGSVTRRGFRASYTTGCGGVLNATTDGEIVSPGWPGDYHANLDCSWILHAPHQGDRLTLTFTHMDIAGSMSNCSEDVLEIREGSLPDSPQLMNLCGSFMPAPFLSQSSTLFLRFASDPTAQRSGFRLVYSTATSVCGGDFTSESGAFTSPSYPDGYPNNIECVWNFMTSPGNRHMISFRNFSLEPSPFCNHDFLEIKEGGPTGQVIGRYCGNQLPNNLTVGTNLWVKFRSNGNGTAPGFMAVYNSLYGGPQTGTTGSISSPQYPRNYPHNANYRWTITVNIQKQITLRFVAMEMETNRNGNCDFDYVTIRDGGSSDSNSIGSYCGVDLPDRIRSTGNQLLVEFHSDYANSGQGFLLQWRAVPIAPVTPSAPSPTGSVPTDACGGDLVATEDFQNFTSPGYPISYSNNLVCNWVIRSEVGSRVEVQFPTIDLERHRRCRYDYVGLFNGETVGRFSRLGRYCGRMSDVGPVQSSANAMTVRLRTDSGTTATGFFGQFRKVCGGVMTSRVGVIQSPGFPTAYDNNANCTWQVSLPSDRQVQLQFVRFDIQSGANGDCAGDYVQLFNGLGTDAPPLGPGYYCGSSLPNIPMTSSNNLYVRFISDGAGTSTGFQLRYRDYMPGCGGTLVLTDSINEGVLMSPSYPDNYPSNVDCVWVITAPAYERVQLDFANPFEIETHPDCNFDYVEVRDGGTDHAPSIGRFCGTMLPTQQFSSANVMHLRFRTDGSGNNKGFNATYKIARCGGTITGYNGTILSPNYPSNYDNDLDCEWRIQGPTGHFLTFFFEYFSVGRSDNCTDDYVELRDFNSTGTEIARGCGYDLIEQTYLTADSYAYLKFHSDSQVARSGFRVTFTASIEECGGDLTTPSGSISSPNYPGAYAHSRMCVWNIIVAPDRRVTLTFNDLNLEYHDHCAFDVVLVRGGALSVDYMNPYLGVFCGSTNPGTLESTNNMMTVVFKTDGAVSGGGFQATYTSDNPIVCGGLLTLADGPGTLQSPGFGQGSYSNSTLCVWQLANHNTDGGSIAVDFTSLSLETHGECMWDFVEIREGSDENGHYVGRYCGNVTSDLPQIVSPSSSLWIMFKSDFFISWEGFQLQYKFTACGGTLSALSGLVTSPNYPSAYSHSQECAWKIVAPEGHQIHLHFTNLNIPQSGSSKCGDDRIEVFNGGLASSPSVGSYCGTSLPTDFYSMSNEVRVTFFSGSGQGTTAQGSPPGFRIEYTVIANACGGLYHAQQGNISSPRWGTSATDQYPNNIQCLWDINVHNGYHIKINFTHPFELEVQDQCVKDYVQVSEILPFGNSSELGLFCGNQFPPDIYTAGNMARVKFRTNHNNTGHGFSLNYTAVCGATYTDSSGTIVSPGYPGNYENNMLCDYTIVHDSQTFIELTFDPSHFHIEDNFRCRYDWVKVYEGSSAAGRLIGQFCGRGDDAPQMIRVRGSIFMQFKTDDSTTDRGWLARYNTSACGGYFNGESGMLQTPTHPNDYHNNANCSWYITVPEDRIVRLKFTQFSLEASPSCNYDYVSLFDGTSLFDPLLGTFCGGVPPPVVQSTGNNMVVQFVSDGSVSRGGFQAGWTTAYGPAQGCGGLFNDTSGEFGSVDIDNDGNYEPDLDCVWVIMGPTDTIVKLTFSSFQLEQTMDCRDADYVEVRDGMFASSPLVGTYCGTTFPAEYSSSSNFLYVRFVSDDVNHQRGFSASFQTEQRLCGGSVYSTTDAQTITSPGYPSNYPPNTRCHWAIDAPQGEKVEVKVTDMDIQGQDQCDGDYLEFRNVLDKAYQPTVHVFCGSVLPQTTLSRRRTMEIVLVTDNSGSGRGFTMEHKIASCSRSYTSPSGRITSPGWPGVYPGNSNCEFTIEAPEGNNLAVFFNAFQTEGNRNCTLDYLEIRNGTNSSAQILTTVCGRTIPDPLFIPNNVLYMKFRNDASLNRNGYDITYISSPEACGGNISIPEGSLTTPGYPGMYPNDTECRWLVRVPARRLASIVFLTFDVPFSAGCSDDYVALYDGSSQDNTLMGRYCGQAMSPGLRSIQMTGNSAFIVFKSQSGNPGTGFRLKFSNRST